MPINRNALLRYKTIDRCLRDHTQYWTLEDLKNACQDALTEYKGSATLKKIGKRTIQEDIRKMRYEEGLGYYAPIMVDSGKYYSYEDPDYSITKVPLGRKDMYQLCEAVDLLKQMAGFSAFDGIEDVVNKLEDHVMSMRFHSDPAILLESNSRLRGLQYIPILHDAIVNKYPLNVTYHPFGEDVRYLLFSPYVLKEYRNRWYVVGGKTVAGCSVNPPIRHLVVDRIERIEVMKNERYLPTQGFNAKEYFKDSVGPSKYGEVENVQFMADRFQTDYITTKPIHESQEVISTDQATGWTTFQIRVHINPELRREFMGVINHIKVLSPDSLVNEIKARIEQAANLYK